MPRIVTFSFPETTHPVTKRTWQLLPCHFDFPDNTVEIIFNQALGHHVLALDVVVAYSLLTMNQCRGAQRPGFCHRSRPQLTEGLPQSVHMYFAHRFCVIFPFVELGDQFVCRARHRDALVPLQRLTNRSEPGILINLFHDVWWSDITMVGWSWPRMLHHRYDRRTIS